nr:MAG TPA: hypothetical protein [Caudoviricetes sp.]
MLRLSPLLRQQQQLQRNVSLTRIIAHRKVGLLYIIQYVWHLKM